MRFTTLLFGTLLVKNGFARTLRYLESRADEPCAQVSAMVAPMRAANPTSMSETILRLNSDRIDNEFLSSYSNNSGRVRLPMSTVRSLAFRGSIGCNEGSASIYSIPIW
jgi:hypothetical protein